MSKYEFDKNVKKRTSYITDSKILGVYIEELYIWLPIDKFNSLFIIDES